MAPVQNSRGLGPAPVRAAAAGAAISGQRALVLERLQQRASPVTIAGLAEELGLHPNTVREHLEALAAHGLAVRGKAAPQGRGRPAWTFIAADVVEPDPRVRDYAGLATALAAHLSRTSDDPGGDAVEAGRVWGRELANADGGGRRSSPAAARRAVVEIVEQLGFAPEADARATTAALRRCPLLDAARRYPDVVCGVHLGIVRGALEVYGGDPGQSDLLPFSEPGACRLELLARG